MLLFLNGCSVSKFIPEGHYLLDNVKVESDNKEIKSSQMSAYLRQTPNAKWFSLVKLPMYIYGAAGKDSTKWMNRFLYRIGDAPRIYDPVLAEETRVQIEQAVRNMGYMSGQVSMSSQIKGKKIKVYYQIHSGEPYLISHIAYDIADYQIHDYLMTDSARSFLKVGVRFDINMLDQERDRITQYLQNRGYYRFNKDFITFQADTMLNTRKVDLIMQLHPYRRKKEDAPSPHRQYYIRNVDFVFDADFADLSADALRGLDSLQAGGVNFYFVDKMFLRPQVISDYNYLKKGRLYRVRDVQNTYSALGRLNILKYSNIRFQEELKADSAYLDAYVMLTRNKKGVSHVPRQKSPSGAHHQLSLIHI